MKVIQRFQTSDGILHETHEKAHKHADNRYGNALTHQAQKLLEIHKYKAMIEYLEANLPIFLEIQKLKDDIEMESEPDSFEE